MTQANNPPAYSGPERRKSDRRLQGRPATLACIAGRILTAAELFVALDGLESAGQRLEKLGNATS